MVEKNALFGSHAPVYAYEPDTKVLPYPLIDWSQVYLVTNRLYIEITNRINGVLNLENPKDRNSIFNYVHACDKDPMQCQNHAFLSQGLPKAMGCIQEIGSRYLDHSEYYFGVVLRGCETPGTFPSKQAYFAQCVDSTGGTLEQRKASRREFWEKKLSNVYAWKEAFKKLRRRVLEELGEDATYVEAPLYADYFLRKTREPLQYLKSDFDCAYDLLRQRKNVVQHSRVMQGTGIKNDFQPNAYHDVTAGEYRGFGKVTEELAMQENGRYDSPLLTLERLRKDYGQERNRASRSIAGTHGHAGNDSDI